MHKSNSALLLVGLLTSACSSAPFSSTREINAQCSLEMTTARTAVRLREQGKSKTQLAEKLPALNADSSRLLWQMHVILEESFDFPEFNEVTYATYRFQHCVRDLQRLPVPHAMPEIRDDLLRCQIQHGDKASAAGTQCIVDVFSQPADEAAQAKLVSN